jgi:hypothetical protein
MLRIEAFYHSHPQHDAYFSAEDRKQATVSELPRGGTGVISVYGRAVKSVKAFAWNDQACDFVEVEPSFGDEHGSICDPAVSYALPALTLRHYGFSGPRLEALTFGIAILVQHFF